jgi:regulator of RNase E activity RraA
MYVTCDPCDAHGEALGVLPTTLRHLGGRLAFHGPAQTLKPHEVNTRVRELANSPDEGEVGIPVVIGGVRINPGDMIVADKDGVIVAPRGLI